MQPDHLDDDEAFIGDEAGGLHEGVEILDDLEGEFRGRWASLLPCEPPDRGRHSPHPKTRLQAWKKAAAMK